MSVDFGRPDFTTLNDEDETPVDALVKCWQIEPYHNNQADFCIIPIRGEENHQKALDYAKDRLEEQWDATAHDETLIPKVEMKIVTLRESEIDEIDDYI